MRIRVLLIIMVFLSSAPWAERFPVYHRPAEWLVHRLADKYKQLKFAVIDDNGIEAVGDWQFLKYIPAELAALDQEPIEQEVEIQHADLAALKALLAALEPDAIIEQLNENHIRLIAAPATFKRAWDLTEQLDAPPERVAVECRLLQPAPREEAPRVMRWTDDPEERIALGLQIPNLSDVHYIPSPDPAARQTAEGLSGQELQITLATQNPISVWITPTVRVDGYVLMTVTVAIGVADTQSKFTTVARVKDGQSWWCSFGTVMLCFIPSIRK